MGEPHLRMEPIKLFKYVFARSTATELNCVNIAETDILVSYRNYGIGKNHLLIEAITCTNVDEDSWCHMEWTLLEPND